jgi:hypothetical protein
MEFTYKNGSNFYRVTVSSITTNSFQIAFVDRTHEGISWRSIHKHMLENNLYAQAGLPESATTNWEIDNERSNENLRTITVRFDPINTTEI